VCYCSLARLGRQAAACRPESPPLLEPFVAFGASPRYRLCSQFGDQVSIPEWYEAFSAAVRGASTGPAREHACAESSAEAQARPAEREFPLERVRGRGRPRKRHKLPKQQEETQKTVEQEAPIAPPSEQERATLQYPSHRLHIPIKF
jgi:hypothetical protein